jgi:hypothetical protein
MTINTKNNFHATKPVLIHWLAGASLFLSSCNLLAATSVQPMPGNTWGELRFPASAQPEEKDNVLLEGAIEQGHELIRLTEKTSLILFGKLNYVVDSEKLQYNNKIRIAPGIKLRHTFENGMTTQLGVKYEVDHRHTTGKELHGSMWFLDWYYNWAPTPSNSGLLSYPGFTWGEIRCPGAQDASESGNTIFEGAIEQGLDWFQKDNTTLNTFAELKYITDSTGLDWNNEYTLGAGIKLKFTGIKNWNIHFGVKYNRERRWKSNSTEDEVIGFLNWSTGWAL